ncbi:MAG TPA: oligopeptide transporter, OPT family [Thermoanaerobaculia bacterium]|nr:oligopeptide transporter, OPT family [Thermoanaerobaculia bacterium]
MSASDPQSFKPYVPASESPAEFTLRAIVMGAVFGLLFGASTVYLALKAGLTVAASIPIAVMAIFLFKLMGGGTILEKNIVQTIGSAGESIAAGVAFTIPALIFLSGGESYFTYFNIFALALVGGTLGVLMMVPLRRALIVKEHGSLLYPEGTACAEVLIAGEKGGNLAKKVFVGLGVAAVYTAAMKILGLWKEQPAFITGRDAALPRANVNCDVTTEYLGVGYIIGPKIAGVLVAGGILSQLVLVPLVAVIGDALPVALKPGVGDKLISAMSPGEIRVGYVRFLGAGAVAAAGLITLIKTLPTIASAFREAFKSMRDLKSGQVPSRTERDIPISFVVIGSLILVGVVALLPQLPGTGLGKLLMGVLVVVFGFFFVTVSSRVVGIIGSSSNPISGMTIATLMATCLIFVALGWTGDAYQALAICVGGMVCIAAANAGNTSQDLKTGYIVGATPLYQQLGLIIGVLASVFAIGFTLNLVDGAKALNPTVPGHAIGSDYFPAPQATLMATIIKGLLAQDLPWGLVFAGMAIAVVVELCGVRSLSFAVGLYLPLSTTLPIFIGGALRGLVDRASGEGAHGESELSSGMLYASGLVAGGTLTGLVTAALQGWVTGTRADGTEIFMYDTIRHAVGIEGFEQILGTPGADLIGIGMFALLAFLLVKAAREKLA